MKVERFKIKGIQAGVSGEYFVAAELTRRGHIASLTQRNTQGIDGLASNQSATKSVAIQVKTKQGKSPVWVMGEKAETNKAENLFYAFVNLGNLEELPSYHIVPSGIVARFIRRNHKRYVRTPGRDGRMRKDTGMRLFRDPKHRFLNRWDLLGLDGDA